MFAATKAHQLRFHAPTTAAVCLLVALFARPAAAQLSVRYDADGTMWVVNRSAGQSAPVRPPTVDAAASSLPPAATSGGAVIRDLTYREAPYEDLISEHARRNNVRPDLIRAVVKVESGFNPYARSPKGALGLMQLMPATARQFNVSNPFDPAQNIAGGSLYLRQLLDRYDNNEELALAAYNAGPGAVDKYGQNVPPYRETQDYVSRVSGIAGEGSGVSGGRVHLVETTTIDGRTVLTITNKKH
jgi:soluble lytic murein transglycosylase-like protein